MKIARSAWLARGLQGLVVAGALSLATGCRESPKAATPPPQPVQVTPVIERDVPIYGEWIGTTVGYVTAQIRPKVSGYLTSQDYREGTLVKTGDLLFRIDTRQFQNALDNARGKLGQAEAQRKQALAQGCRRPCSSAAPTCGRPSSSSSPPTPRSAWPRRSSSRS